MVWTGSVVNLASGTHKIDWARGRANIATAVATSVGCPPPLLIPKLGGKCKSSRLRKKPLPKFLADLADVAGSVCNIGFGPKSAGAVRPVA